MKAMRIVPLLLGLMLVLATTPAAAITYGEPDGEGHPFVGTIFVTTPQGLRYWICSGSLISPTVFLTAGHCTDLIEQLGGTTTVTFVSRLYRGMPVHRVAQVATSPDFSIVDGPGTHGDIGVLVLEAPVYLDEYGALPEAGLLDSLATERGLQDLSVTLVGYGTLGREHPQGGGRPDLEINGYRNTTTATILNLRSTLTDGENLQMSGNPGQDQGGVCFGDSGGPVLLGDSNVIIGINSFVLNNNCSGTAFAYRTDIAAARSFLSQFVALP